MGEIQVVARTAFTRALHFAAANWVLAVGLIAVAALLALCLAGWDFWAEVTYNADHSIKEIKLDRAKVVQQIAVVVLGIPALAFAIWRSWTAYKQANAAQKQAEIAFGGQLLDRYTNAAQLIDSEQQTVRSAGVLALCSLATDAPQQYYGACMSLLATCARDVCERTKAGKTPSEFEKILKQLSEVRRFFKDKDAVLDPKRLDLGGIKVQEISVYGCQLSHTNLHDAVFDKVHFINTNFENSLFFDSKMSEARFTSCNFESADFGKCDFSSPRFTDSLISATNFSRANGISSKSLEGAWAWKGVPPILPAGVSFDNYFDPGDGGNLRRAYFAGRKVSEGFDPPAKE